MFDASKRKNDDKAKGRPRRRIAIVTLLVVLIVVTLLVLVLRYVLPCCAKQPTGQIIYTVDDKPVVLDLQTGERRPYEPTPPPPYDPAYQPDESISPDGKWQVKWVHNEPDRTIYELFITNTETRVSHRFGPIYGGPNYLWSPDSQSFFFAALPEPSRKDDSDGHNGELWRIDIPTWQLIRLTNNTYMEHSMHISPDGKKLAYIAPPDGYSRLHILDVATGQSIIPAPEMFIFFGAWSPDSQWYAFETNHANGRSDIWITRADGSETQPIAIDPTAWERGPIWQP